MASQKTTKVLPTNKQTPSSEQNGVRQLSRSEIDLLKKDLREAHEVYTQAWGKVKTTDELHKNNG